MDSYDRGDRLGESVEHPRAIVARQLLDNLPYAAMVALGSAIFVVGIANHSLGWLLGVLYAVYGAAGALWIMVFVCPYCDFHGTNLCPCGYGRLAAKLRTKQSKGAFHKQFRKHIPVIIPLWFIPPIAGAISLFSGFAWPVLALTLAFAGNSFVILPLVSSKYGCARCPQKDTCPWMHRIRPNP